MENQVVSDLQPYGAWYTQPGGFIYHPEQAVAPAVEDARKRLRRLRQSGNGEPSVGVIRVQLLQLVAIGGLLIYASTYLIFLSLKKDVSVRDYMFAGLLAVGIVAPLSQVLYFLVSPPFRRPERIAKVFLRAAIGFGKFSAHNILLKVDSESERARLVPVCMGSAGSGQKVTDFRSLSGFKEYWNFAFGQSLRSFKLASCKVDRAMELAPDLAVVEAKIKVRGYRAILLLVSYAAFIAGVAPTVLLVVLLFVWMESKPGSVTIFLALAPMFIGLTAGVVGSLYSLVPVVSTSLRVRKILVRVNGQWRLFNGELQGAEEGDVNWLLDE